MDNTVIKNASGYDQANNHVNFIDQFAHRKLAGLKDKVISIEDYLAVLNDSVTKLSKVVFDAPEEYDTLKEIAIYLHDNDINLQTLLVEINTADSKISALSEKLSTKEIELIKLINRETDRVNNLLLNYYKRDRIDEIIDELRKSMTTVVVANPEVSESDPDLTSISINGEKFKIASSKDLTQLALNYSTLGNKVNTIENKMTAIDTDVNNLKKDITETVSDLKDQVSANSELRNNLTEKTTKITYICINGGDATHLLNDLDN